MAQLVIAAAGAAIGSYAIPAGFLGLSGAGIGWAVGSVIGSMFGPKQKSSGPRLEDLRVTGTGYGAPVPWVAGSPRVGGTIIWASNKRETATTTEVGKGGGSEYTEYTYDCDVLYLLSENEIAGVSRIWSNGKLVYSSGVIQDGFCDSVTVYTGEASQLPDPIYEAAVGVGNAPAYRTRGTIMLAGIKLGSGGFLPNLTFEIGGFSDICYGPPSIENTYVITGNPVSYDDDEGTFWTGAVGTGANVTISSTTYRAQEFTFRKYQKLTGTLLSTITKTVYMQQGGVITDNVYHAGVVFGAPQPTGMLVRTITSGSFNRFYSVSEIPAAGVNVGNIGVSTVRQWISYAGGYYWIPYGNDGMLKGTSSTFSANYNYGGVVANAIVEDIYTGRLYNKYFNGSNTFIREFETDPTSPLWSYNLGTGALAGTEASLGFHVYANKLTAVISDPSSANAAFLYVYRVGENTLTESCGRIGVGGTQPVNSFGVGNTFAYTNGNLVDLNIPTFSFQVELPIQDAINNLMRRAEYEEDEYDISEIENANVKNIRAMYLSQVAPTRNALEILQTAFYVTGSKSDKIYFKYRETASAGTFDYDDFGVSDSPEGSENPFPIRNTNALEQPAQISLTYNNMSFDFNPEVASSDILVTDQKSTNAIQLPLGLVPSEAKGIVESMLLDQVASRVQYGPFRLPLSYAKYDPSDVVTIPDTTGSNHRVRLVKKADMGVMLEFEGVGDDEGALIAAGVADDTDQGQTVVEQPSGSLWLAGDWPLFRDSDDNPGYIALGKSAGDGDFWPGAGFFRSWDDVNFSQVGSFLASSVFGTCSTTLANFTGGNVWDESSVLRVNVGSGELSSSTKSAMQTDLTINVAMVGSECIRFRLATLISPGVYDISSLIRGFRGTEWAISSHTSSEDFALVNFNSIRVGLETNQIGIDQYVKAVTFNRPLSTEAGDLFDYTGINLKPFSVANPRALYTEAGLVITWDRRTRRSYSYGGTSGAVVPLGEAFERYRLYIYDDSTLLRTVTVDDAETFTYTEAMASEDGLSSNAIVTIEIVQVSEIVGDGYPQYVEGMMA